MKPYHEIARPASWALLAGTLLQAGAVVVVLLFATLFLNFFMHFVEPEASVRVDRVLWVGASVLVPALFLSRFYFVMAARRYSKAYAVAGWIGSALYHGALMALFVAFPARIDVNNGMFKTPLALVSAAAFCTSFYLLIRSVGLRKDPNP